MSFHRGAANISNNSRVEEIMSKFTGIGLIALVLVVCGLAVAANQADPVGTWKCEYNIGDQKRTSTLMIKKDGDKLTGTMSWPDQKDTPLKDVKSKDGELTFSAERVLGDKSSISSTSSWSTGTRSKGKAHWMSGARSVISTSRGSGRSSSWAIIHQQSLWKNRAVRRKTQMHR